MGDSSSRLHPFDFAFSAVAAQWFPAIRAAADAAELNPLDLPQFTKLEPVQSILAAMQPEADAPDLVEASEEYVRLLYAAFHFSAAGSRTLSISREALERHIANPAPQPGGEASPELTGKAVYCRLPEHLVWAQVGEGEPHEPMDGFFVVAGGAGGAELLIVAILGLRVDRDGFSQISVLASAADLVAPLPAAPQPLAPAMAGGDVAGFHSVSSVAEMLLLTRLALASAA
jgi:hypothetical protein